MQNRPNPNAPRRGDNVRASVNISFEEAVFGCEKQIEINYREECETCHGTGAKAGTSPETCTRCHGTGRVVQTQQSIFGMMQTEGVCPECRGAGKIIKEKCPDCRGTGYKTKKIKIKVQIPAGIDNGMSVRVREKGEPGVNGGSRGDLLVEVRVARHPIFQRNDTELYSTAPISFAKAALGGKIRIKTIDGEVEYDVKAGTQTDTRIRLKGKGVPSLQNPNRRGDHYVTLVVQVPTRLNKAQKEALKKYAEACGES
jgi:molecular chaperone DnaJ